MEIRDMNIIAYIRISTNKQEESGLGLEAQRAAVEALRKQRRGTILAEYIEVETGKRKDRPELAKALAHCRRSKAKLVVAKLDRLARNVAFTSALTESKVDFICCDNPYANKLTIHILSAVAEHEAEAISQRTKDALAAAKSRGIKLGSARPEHWEGREDRRLEGARLGAEAAAHAHAQAADEAYSDILPDMVRYREQGWTLQRIAEKLNRKGHTTRRGKEWSPTQVARVLRRACPVPPTPAS
jgi:DNA invertase Pin-like site-specific DNA recombinase